MHNAPVFQLRTGRLGKVTFLMSHVGEQQPWDAYPELRGSGALTPECASPRSRRSWGIYPEEGTARDTGRYYST